MPTLLEELRSALAERYSVEREIGRGGMATVFLADDLKHGRRVAIKVLSPDVASSLGAERFHREVQIAARLSHPHILPVHDSGEAGGFLYYVMPFVEGESLRHRIERETQLPIEDAIQIACEVADALQYAHDQGVVHRDVKPENVLLHGGHAVVADFGIARFVAEGGQRLTATGVSMGTAHYMSPEQFVGENVDGRADLYSLGCMVYEMLVGEVPFTGPNPMAVIARATMELPSSIRIVRDTVPEEIEDAVMRAIEKVPADRFPSVAQFKLALLGQGTSSYARVTMRHTAARRTAMHQASTPRAWTTARMAVAGAAVVVLAATGLAGWSFLRPKRALSAGALATTPRIAVLYFQADSAKRPLADGLSESLIDRLAQVPALDVISRSGVAPFRGLDPAVALDSAGKALAADFLVRGSVEPTRRGVRVEVALVDRQSNATVDRQGFERDSSQIVQLESDVAGFVLSRLDQEVKQSTTRAQAASAESWLLWQRAERARREADSLAAAAKGDDALAAAARADSLLARAGALDPRWPAIPELRARVAWRRANTLRATPPRVVPLIDSGVAFANQALELDDRSGEAYEMRGKLQYLRYDLGLVTDPAEAPRVLDSAQADLERATKLSPHPAGAWWTLSYLYYRRQSLPQANLAAQEAYRADRFLENAPDILRRLFWTSHDLENFQDADRWCAEGRQRFPQQRFFVECRLWVMTTRYNRDPRPADAWAALDTLRAMTPPAAWREEEALGRILVAGTLARAWIADPARRTLADSARHVLAATDAGPEIDPTLELYGRKAFVLVMLRDYDAALDIIERYLTVHPDHKKGFATNTTWWWRDLQDKPRFRQLTASVR